MEFGLDTFGDITAGPDGRLNSHAQVIREVIEQAVLADRLGIDAFGVGEHHRPDFAVSAPEVVLAAIAGRTQRILLGSAVTVLSSDDPIRVFERFATVDAASNGRAEVTLGRGSFTESFPLFGFDLAQYEALFEEKLDLFAALLPKTLDTRRRGLMRSRTGRMAHFATKVGVAATMAMVLAMLGAMLPRVSAGLSPADEPAPDKAKADAPKGEPSKPAPAKVGLLLNDSRAFQGYTLIAPMFSKTTYLIDMKGKVVRTWESDYTPGASAYLLENGHLLRTGAHQPTPSGFGPGAGGRVQEFDWDGQLVWDFKYVQRDAAAPPRRHQAAQRQRADDRLGEEDERGGHRRRAPAGPGR